MKQLDESEKSKVLLPSSAVSDAWFSEKWTNGVQIDELEELQTLSFQTRNHTYDLTVIDPGTAEVIVRGGKVFTEPTRATVSGASRRGSFLKRHGIYPGFNLEFRINGKRLVTTPVLRIVLQQS